MSCYLSFHRRNGLRRSCCHRCLMNLMNGCYYCYYRNLSCCFWWSLSQTCCMICCCCCSVRGCYKTGLCYVTDWNKTCWNYVTGCCNYCYCCVSPKVLSKIHHCCCCCYQICGRYWSCSLYRYRCVRYCPVASNVSYFSLSWRNCNYSCLSLSLYLMKALYRYGCCCTCCRYCFQGAGNTVIYVQYWHCCYGQPYCHPQVLLLFLYLLMIFQDPGAVYCL